MTVRLAAGRRLIVLGRPGGGRTTTLATLVAGLDRLGAASDVEVIDDGDRLADDEVRRRLELADRAGRPVVVAASTSTARTFGGWLARCWPTPPCCCSTPAASTPKRCGSSFPI
ncbi:MAG: hypothetical protein R2710_21655 [Acidimicrobiales bacterium]